MALGAQVRRLFGPVEPIVAECYRSIFMDMDAFTRQLRRRITPERVLEVGCGEGALTTRMARIWPHARIDGIDLTPRLGRLFSGDRSRVRFQRIPVQEYVAAEPGVADLVIIGDVMHHIPWEEHPGIFQASAQALRPGGTLIVKEWIRDGNPVYWLGYASDRYVSGERIRYGTRDEWLAAFRREFGPTALQGEFSIAPWSCNQAFVLSPESSRLEPRRPV